MILICSGVSFSAVANEEKIHTPANHALGFSAGWVSGNGLTYRYYLGDYFFQATAAGMVANNGDDIYLNTALSVGKYLHRLPAKGILPPLGLKLMAGADYLAVRQLEMVESADKLTFTEQRVTTSNSYYGGGVGVDIGNPGRKGLSFWIAYNFVSAYQGLDAPVFEWFGPRPSAGVLYSW